MTTMTMIYAGTEETPTFSYAVLFFTFALIPN